jgi:glycosyltransferase involved in cell wall biosynthesis
VLSRSTITFGAVAIGRNEGARLETCLTSLSSASVVVYVDSGSIDGSVQRARQQGAEVVDLDLSVPFTAARARNAGFRRLRGIAPELRYIQFIDGDCELDPAWPAHAVTFLEGHADVGAVSGRTRERWPERSIYNWLCEQEWNEPAGETRAFGGIVMVRKSAFEEVGGYRDDLIAGEEPELCVRLRAAGWRMWRLDSEMTLHDAAMMHFGQWWRRVVRSGYAFAQGAQLHGKSPERHWVWESRRAWLWGVWLPLAGLIIGIGFSPWGFALWFIYPLQMVRQILRNHGPIRDRAVIALFQVLARFPEALGQCRFLRDRLFGRPGRLIEYK